MLVTSSQYYFVVCKYKHCSSCKIYFSILNAETLTKKIIFFFAVSNVHFRSSCVYLCSLSRDDFSHSTEYRNQEQKLILHSYTLKFVLSISLLILSCSIVFFLQALLFFANVIFFMSIDFWLQKFSFRISPINRLYSINSQLNYFIRTLFRLFTAHLMQNHSKKIYFSVAKILFPKSSFKIFLF
jgi:hypothetical protein